MGISHSSAHYSKMNSRNGEDSNDECCVCGDEWSIGQQGWVLCDGENCENTVCAKCTSMLSLSVSELFYCPICAGSGESAAAVVGGAVAAAVAACSELEKLPLSFNATKRILTNLLTNQDEVKFRKMRLENKRVKELVDLEPVLNILTSVGFVRMQVEREAKSVSTSEELSPKEEVLLLEGTLPIDQIEALLKIMDGLSPEVLNADGTDDNDNNAKNNESTEDTNAKRKQEDRCEDSNNKKCKSDE